MKQIATLLLVAVCLTGCSGEYVREGVGRENETPSVEVVSGGAVSVETGSGATYVYHNSTDLYIEKDDITVEHRRLDGTLVEDLKLLEKGKNDIYIMLVTEDWLYYKICIYSIDSAGVEQELWRIPLQKEKEGDKVRIQDQELVLKSEDGIYEVCTIGDYIYYTDLIGNFIKYNTVKKENVTFTGDVPEMGDSEICTVHCLGTVGDAVILTVGSDTYQYYIQKKNATDFILFDDVTHEGADLNDGKEYYYSTGNAYFDENELVEVKVYQVGEDESKTLFTSKEMNEKLKERGNTSDIDRITYMQADKKRLYLRAELRAEPGYDDLAIFSCEIGNEAATLQVEQKLKDFFEDQETDDFYVFDGEQVLLVDDYGYDTGVVKIGQEAHIYNMATGEMRMIDQSEPEYWWPFYEEPRNIEEDVDDDD